MIKNLAILVVSSVILIACSANSKTTTTKNAINTEEVKVQTNANEVNVAKLKKSNTVINPKKLTVVAPKSDVVRRKPQSPQGVK